MFDESLVVASAVSAFNNAAVVAPAFLWNAVLASPLFVAVYVFGRKFLDGTGLRPYVTGARINFWTIVFTALWVVFMGGNYDVLRDGVSLLPWVTAVILFAASVFIGINTRAVKFPIWYGRRDASKRRRWWINVLVFAIAMVPVGLSDTLNWWGPILQIGAVLIGFILGRRSGWQIRATICAVGVMLATTIGILMQPELWRFGQLGNLTPAHLIWIMMVGILAAATIALGVVNARGRIHQSAYVKLKWLMRFVTVLAVILFLLTEAVPIFIGAIAMAFVLFAMSVWHSESVPDVLVNRAVALTTVAFGVLTGLVVVTAMGVLWYAVLRDDTTRADAKFLL